MTKTWALSDTHIGDDRLAVDRGFADAVEMQGEILGQINARVGVKDTLLVLGDVVYGVKKSEYLSTVCNFVKAIVCEDKRLILGNHDDIRISIFFRQCDKRCLVHYKGVGFVLDHYAAILWFGMQHGNIQLYGHSHDEAEEWLDTHMPGRRSMDVGVDAVKHLYGYYGPVCLDAVLDRLGGRPGFYIDHHRPKVKTSNSQWKGYNRE